MPSDVRARDILTVLRQAVDRFEASVATTAEEVRLFLEEEQASGDGQRRLFSTQFGSLGERLLDTERLATLVADERPTTRIALEVVERALTTLDELAKTSWEFCTASVPPNGNLYEVVTNSLARTGRAFGAARVVQAVRSGRYQLGDHARSLGSFPFSRWNSGERRLGPPLVVEVDGADLRAGALAEFLDGTQKIVLLVRGPCAPAPLVRLISPATFVAQTDGTAALESLAQWNGPGIAALVPDGCALFRHDPRGGAATWDRLTIDRLPATTPRKPVAGLSAAQQGEEVDLLKTLAARPPATASVAGPAGPAAAEPEADPVDKLAAWLLSQAEMPEAG